MKLIPSPALAKACSDRNRLARRVAIYPTDAGGARPEESSEPDRMPAPPARVRYDFVMTFARPQRIRLPLKIVPRSLNELEARAGIEPAHRGFADLGLTTWLPRPNRALEQAGGHQSPQAERRAKAASPDTKAKTLPAIFAESIVVLSP